MKRRGVFWKIYAWCVLIFFAASAFNPAVYGWALYIPLSVGCLLFAYNKLVRYPWVWKIFLCLYIIFFLAPFVLPILSRASGKTILGFFAKGLLNIFLMAPALYALWQRGYNTELMQRS